MKIKRAIGIDLGTTNSAVAMKTLEDDQVLIYADESQEETYPSMLAYDETAESYVTGWEAFRRRHLSPDPISSIKRKMGKRTEVKLGPQSFTPEEVSERILKDLTGVSSGFFVEHSEVDALDTSACVITVPAYFDANQIDATRRAGELAGLEVLSLVQEPTAACMYYAWRHGIGDGKFLVYDLGGGTFDVSVIRSLHGEFQVLGIDGDNFLGGDDFDRRLGEFFWNHLIEEGAELGELDTSEAEKAWRFSLLKRVAREVKESLSQTESEYVARRDIFEDLGGAMVTLELEISRETFEAMIVDFVDESIKAAHRALEKSQKSADVGLADIEYVLLVGGSTKIPMIQRRVADAFCGEVSKAEAPLSDHPDTCVALGAAVQAANLGGIEMQTDEATLKITTSLYTHEEEIRIAGLVTECPNASQSLALIGADGQVHAVSRLQTSDEGMRFSLDSVALDHIGAHGYDLEICDDDGDPLSSFPIKLTRGTKDDFKPTGSALSNPTVLARPIYLETVREGRPDRTELLPEGSTLPTTERFRFKTSDKSGAVVLRLFQSRLPIRTIHLAIPEDTPMGSPVDLDLSVDETMSIVARGEVVGQKFWAQVEPPPPAEVKDFEEIERLLECVDEVERQVWGRESQYFRELTTPLVQGIHETARTDPDRLQALVTRLEDVLENYQVDDTSLTPAWGRAQALLDAVKRVVYRDDSRRLGMSGDQWRERLVGLEARAREAYDAQDQGEWTRAFDQIQATWESLAQDEFRFKSGADAGEHVQALIGALHQRVSQLHAGLTDFDYSANPETRALQEAEIDSIRNEIETKLSARLSQLDLEEAPARLKPEVDRLFETLTHLEKRLERVPTLGLVSK